MGKQFGFDDSSPIGEGKEFHGLPGGRGARGDGDTVGVDDFVVGIGEEFEGAGVFGAEGLVALDGVERDAEHDRVERVVLVEVALEVVCLK